MFLWYQGESDAGRSTEDYQARLKDLVSRVRKHANNTKMTAVIIQLASCGTANLASIREAQRQFVINDPKAILVPALGRSMRDSCHLDTPGYQTLGREVALALLKNHYGKTQSSWPGPVMDQAVLSEEGALVYAHFGEAQELLGLDLEDFKVFTAQGTIPCTRIESRGALAILTLQKPVILPAQLAYGARPYPASSLQDEDGNRAPAVMLKVTQGKLPDEQSSSMRWARKSGHSELKLSYGGEVWESCIPSEIEVQCFSC